MTPLAGLLYREWALFKHRFWVITTAAFVTPMLYLIAFGWGLGDSVRSPDGGSYLHYILPGLAAMNVMLTSYSNTANEVGISRIFYGTFESYMISPLTPVSYSVGKVISGSCYGLYGCLVLLGLMLICGDGMQLSWYFVVVLVCTAATFASLGLVAGLSLNSHQALNRFATFVITPMTFLCGTFFPVAKMPDGIRQIITALPLTHANAGLRLVPSVEDAPAMLTHVGVLLGYLVFFFALAVRKCRTSE